jgi:signal transduction histidine kinase
VSGQDRDDRRAARATRRRKLAERLQSLERWLRTSPRQISVLVVLMTTGTLLVQDHVKQNLWLVFTYSFPVALAGYGLGLQGGVATALVATALLYDHAVGTLNRPDTVFVLTTRLTGNLALTCLAALASTTARARELYLVSRNRLAQLQDDLVAAFAHDVRSPLAAILGYASMLQEETESGNVPPDLVPTLGRISANALHVEDMIAEMLNVEHSAAPVNNVVTSFSGESLLGDLRDEFDPIARTQRRDVAWIVVPGTPPLETDHRKLVSVVRNLVGNALKYARDGGVTVRIGYDAASRTHRIEVGDNGPGIPQQALPRLFDRFYRVGGTRDRDGFGLGLFIVKRMMDMLGGEVSVQSEIGHGTRFLLTVPRLDASPPLPAVAEG